MALVGVTKDFGNVHAVDDVTLTVEDGEFFTLLGPSGCGKTTTLRIVAGLETPSRGSVLIGGRDVTGLPPKDRNVAMVFQNYALYPHMTIAENVGYPLKVRRRGRKEAAERVRQAADSLQIAELLARRPSEISGGQQQRAALARAIVHEPNVFLFDEPLSNLDAKLRMEARAFLKHLQKELGITTIYVTHDQTEAMAMSDRIAVMDRGRVIQTGRPADVYRNPANTFVAGFMGNPPMNLLSGELQGDGARVALVGCQEDRSGPPLIPVVEALLPPGAARGAVWVGIRPEDITVRPRGMGSAAAGEDEMRRVIRGHVFIAEPLGSETLLNVSAGAEMLRAKLFGEHADLDLPSGTPVELTVRLDRVRVFPRKPGEKRDPGQGSWEERSAGAVPGPLR